jgi:hypothetical protein
MWRWPIAIIAAAMLLAGCDQTESGTASPAAETIGQSTAPTTRLLPTDDQPGATQTTSPTPTHGQPTPTRAPGGSPSRQATTRTPTKTTTVPDLQACASGTCVVAVGPGTAIPLPANAGVQNLKVTSVTTDRVTLTGQDAGNYGFGSCVGQCDLNDTNGSFTVTLGPNSTDTQNGMSIVVTGFDNGRAILKVTKN